MKNYTKKNKQLEENLSIWSYIYHKQIYVFRWLKSDTPISSILASTCDKSEIISIQLIPIIINETDREINLFIGLVIL